MFLVVTKLLDDHMILAGPYKTALGARRVARKRGKRQPPVSWQVIIERGTRAADSVWVLQGTFDETMVPLWGCVPANLPKADWQDVIRNFAAVPTIPEVQRRARG